jgi:hypothetical protein
MVGGEVMNRRQRVALFLKLSEENGENYPLYLSQDHERIVMAGITDPLNLDKLVLSCLSATRHCGTYKVSGSPNFASGRTYPAGGRRSSFDIWRILKGLGINIPLTTVMESLYRSRHLVYTNVCGGAGRRMFRVCSTWGLGSGVDSVTGCDEYGLRYDEWDGLNDDAGLTAVTPKMYDPNGVLFRREYASEIDGPHSDEDDEDFDPEEEDND